MKTSNILILIAFLGISGMVVSSSLNNYVTPEEAKQNSIEGRKTFTANLYNYKKFAFDKPFDNIVVVDTVQHKRSGQINFENRKTFYTMQRLSWVKDNAFGIKRDGYSEKSSSFLVKNNTLYIYANTTNHREKLIVYSPTLKSIEVKNHNLIIHKTSLSHPIITLADSAEVILEDNQFGALNLSANSRSSLLIKDEYVDSLNVKLNHSLAKFALDSCNFLKVIGGSGYSQISLDAFNYSKYYSDTYKGKRDYTYKHLMYNDELGYINLNTLSIQKVTGNLDKITLNNVRLKEITSLKNQLLKTR